jgi:outer membrane protein OmpA-like peptidoglycan-associated protein
MSKNDNPQITEDSAVGFGWLFPILVLILIAAGAWYLYSGSCNKPADTVVGTEMDSLTNKISKSVNIAAGKLDSLSGDFVYDMGNLVTIDLPNNGGKLVVGENSTENKLYTFLNDKSSTIDSAKGNWFEFTNTHFKTGGAQLDSGSIVELKNITAIIKSFPSAKFKIGGYTDNIGDSIFNVALSQKRAAMVASQLEILGAPSTQLVGAAGYGQQYPIGDNAIAIGRAQNRRVAVNVKAK